MAAGPVELLVPGEATGPEVLGTGQACWSLASSPTGSCCSECGTRMVSRSGRLRGEGPPHLRAAHSWLL